MVFFKPRFGVEKEGILDYFSERAEREGLKLDVECYKARSDGRKASTQFAELPPLVKKCLD